MFDDGKLFSSVDNYYVTWGITVPKLAVQYSFSSIDKIGDVIISSDEGTKPSEKLDGED